MPLHHRPRLEPLDVVKHAITVETQQEHLGMKLQYHRTSPTIFLGELCLPLSS
jgi:hypothetical protein